MVSQLELTALTSRKLADAMIENEAVSKLQISKLQVLNRSLLTGETE